MTYLAQKRPGEWFLFSDHIAEPVPVPSWLVEQNMEDRNILARALGRIYGTGRVVGQVDKLKEIRNVLELE